MSIRRLRIKFMDGAMSMVNVPQDTQLQQALPSERQDRLADRCRNQQTVNSKQGTGQEEECSSLGQVPSGYQQGGSE